MVRAILDGRKTQTRRVVKPQCVLTSGSGFSWKGFLYGAAFTYSETVRNFAIKACPYGKPGDQLWVRETFCEWDDGFVYAATCSDQERSVSKFKPSIHMPRRASRIQLEIVSVRVERLNEISEADAKAEGVQDNSYGNWRNYRPDFDGDKHDLLATAKESYQSLWESINGAGSWAENPWVWVVEFKRI